jgi:MscS family membrane protein
MILLFVDTDASFININRIFLIGYVLLIATLLYRTVNVLAYIKLEQIKKSKILKNEVMNLAMKVINGFIILIAFIAMLKILGVNLTALLSGLGIASAAVAFAAKDSIANMFGSISILVGDVFEQGDWIESKDVNGTVVEIGLRASTIRTFDNALVSVPNSELANFSVTNWSRRSIGRRINIKIGVTYASDFDDIRHAITDIRTMLKTHLGIANEHTAYQDIHRQSKLVSMEDYSGIKRNTMVFMDAFGDSSINILIDCFSSSVEREAWLKTKEDILFKIAEILKKNHLDFAYPSLMLYHAEQENKTIQETDKSSLL